jgi:hypothetical protein
MDTYAQDSKIHSQDGQQDGLASAREKLASLTGQLSALTTAQGSTGEFSRHQQIAEDVNPLLDELTQLRQIEEQGTLSGLYDSPCRSWIAVGFAWM